MAADRTTGSPDIYLNSVTFLVLSVKFLPVRLVSDPVINYF